MGADFKGRNLLYGILGLQINLISEDQLLIAFRELTSPSAKETTMRGIFKTKFGIKDELLQALDTLVDDHLEKHDGDSNASLSSISLVTEGLHHDLTDAIPDLGSILSISQNQSISPVELTVSATVGQPSSDGRFQILRDHARGGLGEVFVALDQELDREVALKKIRGELDSPDQRERFLREAEVTGKLEHPGIVPVYGIGTDANNRPFYVMRFIRGKSLRDAIKHFHRDGYTSDREQDESGRNKEFRKLLNCFVDSCNAISYAHSRGVLHRDIKPSNIMMGKFGETNVVDWGLARISGVEDISEITSLEKRVSSKSSGNSSKTIDGQTVGTPAYMSPEQASGRIDQIGPHSDVYCLGTTLYTILTGVAPFQGERTSVISDVINGHFQKPTIIKPDVSKELEAICLKAMSKQPSGRYESPELLANDIESWIAGEPVKAWPEPMTYRVRRWMRNHQATVATLAATVLFVLGGSILASFLLGAKNSELANANEEIQEANTALAASINQVKLQRKRADTVKNYLVDIFEKTDPTSDGRALTIVELLDNSIEKIERQTDTDPLTQADLYAAIGVSYLGQGLYQKALATYQKELSIREKHQDSEDRTRLRASYHVAHALWRLSEYAQALETVDTVLKKQIDVLSKENGDTLTSMNLKANCLQILGRLDESRELYREIVELRKKVHGEEGAEVLMALNNLASSYSHATDYEMARELYQNVVDRRRELQGETHLETLQAKLSLADTLRHLGRFSEALPIFEVVVAERMSQLGEDHPRTLYSKERMVMALQADGQYSTAVPILETVVRGNKESLGENHASTLQSMNTLAITLVRIGKYNEAIALLIELLPKFEAKYGSKNNSVNSIVNNLAFTYRSNGQYAEAMPLFERAYLERLATLGKENDKTILTYNNWALAIHSHGDWPQSIPMLKTSYEEWKKKAGPNRPNTLSSARYLASGLSDVGKYDSALPILESTRKKQIELLTESHPNTLYTSISLARTLLKTGELERANKLINRVVELSKEKKGDSHPQTLDAMILKIEVDLEFDRIDSALKLLLKTLVKFRDTLGDEHPKTYWTMTLIAHSYSLSKKIELSDQFFEKTINGHRRKLGNQHPKTIRTLLSFCEHQLRYERYSDALVTATELWSAFPTQADRNLFPIEEVWRKKIIDLHIKLFTENGDSKKLSEWKEKS